MKISEIALSYGPSRFGRRPMVRFRLDLESLVEWPAGRLGPAFLDRLQEQVIELRECPGWSGANGVRDRFSRGDEPLLAEIFAQVVLALLRSVGARVSVSQVQFRSEPATYEVACEFKAASVARVVTGLAMAEMIAALPQETGLRDQTRLPEKRRRFRSLAKKRGLLDAATFLLIEAAESRGIPWGQACDHLRLVRLGYGSAQRRISGTLNSCMDPIAAMIARDKVATAQLLGKAGIPVPRQMTADTLDQARQAAKHLGYPLVVKPRNLGKGKEVHPGVSGEGELDAAFENVKKVCPSVLIETFIPGADHRLLVIGGKLVAASKRIPAHVIGDGRHSVRDLVRIENENPLRREGDGLDLMRLGLDDESEKVLRSSGFTGESVPAAGEAVFLRLTANISTGGTAVDVTDSVHPEIRRLVERAVELIGLNVAGVDYLCPDISVPPEESGGAIIEINERPGFGPHWVTDQGARDVAGPLIDLLFPSAESSRIPIAAVTGTDGKTTTCRMLAAILKGAGHCVGLAITDGVEIDGQRTVKGDAASAQGAQVVLSHPRVDAAVLETARGGILNQGIAFDRCDVAAVTNISSDHLGYDGVETLEDMAKVKRLVVELATGTAVLNADDERCLGMIPFVTAAHLCLVSLDEARPALREHLERGGRAVYLEGRPEDGWIVIQDSRKRWPVMRPAEIPATWNGLATHNLQNALFAIALAHGLGIGIGVIRSAMARFECSFENTPGRLNAIPGFPFQVILDYGHNAAEVEAVCRFAQALPIDGRRICFLTAPGNRREVDIEAIGRAAAGRFDYFVCGNRGDLRGREPEFVPETIRRGLMESGTDPGVIAIHVDAEEGVVKTLEAARAGDLVLIFNRDYRERRHLIESFRDSRGPGGAVPRASG